ncbi:MAG: hypothetical protein QXK08_03030 [Candidatus Woesearchaeota archaeon]
MKRGQIAVFLVVIFIAAIGLLVVFSEPSTTGMFWGPTLRNLSSNCGSVCLRDSDCAGECSGCSLSLGRCVSLKTASRTNTLLSDRYSWRNAIRCKNTCSQAYRYCMSEARTRAMYDTCRYYLSKCLASCDNFNTPVGKDVSKV